MDCIIYMDLFFLINFWMNALVLMMVRSILKIWRTGWCLLGAAVGATGVVIAISVYIKTGNEVIPLLIEAVTVVLMNLLAFGCRSLLWHMFLFWVTGAATAGACIGMLSTSLLRSGSNGSMIIFVTLTAGTGCFLLEKQCRIRWKEEHMKAKTVLEYGDRKIFATALMDTGNKLYDPFFHKPVILVDESMMKEMLADCRRHHPERLHYIPFHSVGTKQGMLEGITFDCVYIRWQDKLLQFTDVIGAATKEGLYQGKEYRVIFHPGLLEEG